MSDNVKITAIIVGGVLALVLVFALAAASGAFPQQTDSEQHAEDACIARHGVPIKTGSAGLMEHCEGL